MSPLSQTELAAYLARIGLAEEPAPGAAGLASLQHAHRAAIPFENLDIALGRGVSLDPDAMFAKLVTQRRGGYCFEQNLLLLRALRRLGFAAEPALARVWLLGADPVPPRTHLTLIVTLGGQRWIADAGFGGSVLPPLRLDGSAAAAPDGVIYRIRPDPDHGWMVLRDEAPQYSFTEAPVWPADLEQANHWTATSPASRFVQNPAIVTRPTPDGFASLVNRTLKLGGAEHVIAGASEYRALLAELFGIELAADDIARLGLGLN